MAKIDPRERLVREALGRISRGYDALLLIQRAFEREACSCSPLRAESEALKAELHQTELYQRIEELDARIRAIDLREHAGIDAAAREAHPFFAVWLFDQLGTGGLEVMEAQAMARQFARDWQAGWRPNKGGVDRELPEKDLEENAPNNAGDRQASCGGGIADYPPQEPAQRD